MKYLSCATNHPWTKEQVVLQGVAIGLKIIDFGQTLDIADKPEQYEEISPAIGKHPSKSRVKKYFYTSLIVQPVITHYLPMFAEMIGFNGDGWREWWLGTNIVVSGSLVGHNKSVGLRVNF